MKPTLPLLTTLLLAPLGVLQTSELHVSINGSDDGPGTRARPFCTITCARDAVRELKRQGAADGPIEVVIHGGTYFLPETVLLTPADSDHAESHPPLRTNPLLQQWRSPRLAAPNLIANNLVADVWGWRQLPGGGRDRHIARGIYLDWFTASTRVENNIIFNTRSGRLQFNTGDNNEFVNNVVVSDTTRWDTKWRDAKPTSQKRAEKQP